MRIGNMGIGGGAMLGALLAALPAGAAATAGFVPNWVEGHHASTLVLTGESQMCAPVFSHQETYVSGGALVLSVLEQERPGVLCTNATSWPYRTEFTVPGMDSGIYPVKVRWRKACEFDLTPCLADIDTQTVGNLRVTDSAALTYHISPRSVPAGRASDLILHGPFGCSDRISVTSIDTARPTILLNFGVVHPAGQCDTIVVGFPFPLPPLNAGIWQVHAIRSPCEPGTVCNAMAVSALAGALEVKASPSSMPAPARKPRSVPVESGRGGFRADWLGAPRDAAGRLDAGPRDVSEQNLPGGKP